VVSENVSTSVIKLEDMVIKDGNSEKIRDKKEWQDQDMLEVLGQITLRKLQISHSKKPCTSVQGFPLI
jgi:hypothetical protein